MSTSRRFRRALAAGARRRDPQVLDIANLIKDGIRKADDVEYVQELEQENKALNQRFREVQLELEPQLLELAEQRASRHFLTVLAKKVEDLERHNATLLELPRTLSEVVEAVARIDVARILFTPEAKMSAAAAEFNQWRECSPVAWRLLRAMATVLFELYATPRVDIPREFRARTGFEVSMSEGRKTKRTRGLMRLRRVDHECGPIDIDAHAKFGNSHPRLLRVHYGFCPLCLRIVVGHCGDHLPTASRRR